MCLLTISFLSPPWLQTTGGSPRNPTPLPSVHSDTLAAWGASKPPLPPPAQLDRELRHLLYAPLTAFRTHQVRVNVHITRTEEENILLDILMKYTSVFWAIEKKVASEVYFRSSLWAVRLRANL